MRARLRVTNVYTPYPEGGAARETKVNVMFIRLEGALPHYRTPNARIYSKHATS